MAELSVCIGSSCHLKGAYNVVQTFQQMMEEYGVREEELTLRGAFCTRQCAKPGVAVALNGTVYQVRPEDARRFFRETVLPRLTREKP